MKQKVDNWYQNFGAVLNFQRNAMPVRYETLTNAETLVWGFWWTRCRSKCSIQTCDASYSDVVPKTGGETFYCQEWEISGPRGTCGPPQHFQWTAEAFRKNPQVRNFLQLMTVNVSVEANLNRNLLLFLLEKRFSSQDREVLLENAKVSMWGYV